MSGHDDYPLMRLHDALCNHRVPADLVEPLEYLLDALDAAHQVVVDLPPDPRPGAYEVRLAGALSVPLDAFRALLHEARTAV